MSLCNVAPITHPEASAPLPGEYGNLSAEQESAMNSFVEKTIDDRNWHLTILKENNKKLKSIKLSEANESVKPLIVSINSITDQEIEDEYELDWKYEQLRFLRAHKFDIDKASQNYHDYIIWRKEKLIDKILFEIPPKMDLIHLIIPSNLHGRLKNGSPLYIERSGSINPAALLSLISVEEALYAHIWCQEMQVFRCKEYYRETNKKIYIDKFANILDIKGFHLEQRRGLKYTKSIANLDAKMYPERMSCMYIINAPRIFPPIFNIIKQWLDPVTKTKIHVISSSAANETLAKVFELNQLPQTYGGTCSTCITAPDCIPLSDTTSIIESLPFSKKLKSTPHIKFNLAAGKSITKTLDCKKDDQIIWSLESGGYEIGFGITFQPSNTEPNNEANNETTITVIEMEKSSPGKVPLQGSYTSDLDGIITFTIDNSFSWMTSKNIDYCFTIFKQSDESINQSTTSATQ